MDCSRAEVGGISGTDGWKASKSDARVSEEADPTAALWSSVTASSSSTQSAYACSASQTVVRVQSTEDVSLTVFE